jgi:hypothetical protein
VREGVAGGAVDPWQVAERQRVLQVASGTRSEEVTAVEKALEAGERGGEARVGPDLGDPRVEDRQVRPEPLQAERAGGIERVE